MTPLEQSLIEFATKHGLTSLDVGYRNWDCAKANPFSVIVHFNNAREGEFSCGTGDGATIADALNAAICEANKRRAPLADDVTGSIDEVAA